ncbi:hypothetical protein BV898_13833 [Hypsibius exemplaris]|uniref:G-protein coupled receptors family 1 profile domain-containing protein n=1 Tax=Hypsibius exemplaris TaxID=2072580 RepID=A0A1W0W9I9_HYPEX|nr:hypothetical protein BV898_13833 [Hypsibius exemplaris]
MESLIGVIRFESPQQLENNLTSPIKESKEAERNRYIQIYVLFGLAGLGCFSNIVVGVLLYQKCRRKRRFTNLDYSLCT